MTDRAVKEAFSTLVRCFEGKMRRARAVRIVEDLFRSIPFDSSAERPKVAIFGDLYVRDNTVFNQDLVRTIERAGGEAIVTSYNDYAKIIASPMFSRLKKNGELVSFARYRILLGLLQTLERLYMQGVTPLVGPVYPYVNRDAEKQLGMFHLRLEHEGESAENVLKVLHLLERYPDISLFVQVSPAFCCPALVTEAMTEDIERITGIPVLSITYDGTCADGTGSGGNDVIFPQLALQLGRPSRPAGVSE
jgi:predicted nucleotide-binding protein (sugar kinase/HSP70/actin superfamily)